MGWIIGCFLVIIMYAVCVISSRCARDEEKKQIENMINTLEKK